MPPPRDDVGGDEGEGNADRRSQWFGRAQGIKAGKGERRPNPATVPIPGQTPTGPAWVPAGPAAIRNGQAFGAPAVSGRVMDIEVGPQGRRAYAATADGGVWRYTEDHAVNPPASEWVPLHDGVRSLDATTSSANALATGAITVRWGATPADDALFIGTGEIHPAGPASLNNPGDRTWVAGGFAGVGVRISTGEPGPTGVTQEATNLDGHGFTRLVQDPNSAEVVWAGTDIGVYRRPANGSRVNWSQITDASFPGGSNWFVTDLAITGTGAGTVVWVAFWNRGVWQFRSNAWSRVNGIPLHTATPQGNIVIAASDTNVDAVYALTESNQLYRFDGTTFQQLTTTPPQVTSGQGWYDLAVAVQPGSPNQVVVAGDLTWSDPSDTEVGNWDAMVLTASVTMSGPTWDFGFDTVNNLAQNDHVDDATFIGQGVHPDMHRVVFGRNADLTLNPNDVWLGCDGGIFRSTSGLVNGVFQPVNVGLSSIQFNHLANHPSVSSVVLAGSQDNGVMRSSGSSTWYEAPQGDGGGVAIDPDNPRRMAGQFHDEDIKATRVGGIGGGEWRDIDVPVSTRRDGTNRLMENPDFYSPLRTAPAGSNPMILAYPTHRVWASANWGRRWVTIPSGRRPTNAQVNHDSPTGARTNLTDIIVVSSTVIYACTPTNVYRYQRNTAPTNSRPVGVWAAPTALPTTGLPAGRSIQAMAIESDAGPRSLYVALGTTGGGVDHVFWFDDGATRWRPTGLGGSGITFDVPLTCIVLDPTVTNDVYVGSAVGVWKGVRTVTGGNRTWAWINISTALPEATVLDLSISAFGSGAGALRLLRAATHGRGLWELELGAATTADPDVFLRMNTADGGRRHATMRAIDDPERMPGATTTWLSSPDIRLRRPSIPIAAPQFDRDLRRGHKDRRRWNGANGSRPIRFLQRNAVRRGVTTGIDGDFGGGMQTAVQTLQRRYAIREQPNGRADRRTWDAITSAPSLPARIDPYQFEEDIRLDYDETTGAMIADATGTNRLFAQLHARGTNLQTASTVRATLLLAPLIGTPLTAPPLPAGWAGRIAAGDRNWVAASGWVQVGGASPYRSPPGDLSDRGPEIVEWNVDFAALGFNAGDQVVALVAVHTADQPLTVATRNANDVVEATPVVAARHIRLDAVTAIPPP